MSHQLSRERDLNTGFALRWMTNTTEIFMKFPGKRGRYVIGLKALQMTIQKTATHRSGRQPKKFTPGFFHICMNPPIFNAVTFLPNNASVSAVKSLYVAAEDTTKDFSQNMEYFQIDLSTTDMVSFYIVDSQGSEVPASCSFMFDIYEA